MRPLKTILLSPLLPILFMVNLNASGHSPETEVSKHCPGFSVGLTSSVDSTCINDPITFNPTGNYYQFKSWYIDFGDGTIATNSDEFVHEYSEAGMYEVRLIVDGGVCGKDTTQMMIKVKTDNLPLNASGALNYTIDQKEACPNTTIEFDASGIATEKHTWDFGTGDTAAYPQTWYKYAQEDTFPVALTVENGCGYDSTLYDTVIIKQQDHFSGSMGLFVLDDSVCINDYATVNATADYEYYKWTIDGDTIRTERSYWTDIAFDSAGWYPVSVQAFDECGNDTTVYDSIKVVNSIPISSVNFSIDYANDTACVLDPVNFHISSFNGSLVLDFGDGASYTEYIQPFLLTSVNVSHQYDTVGSYPVTLTLTNFCGNDTVIHDTVVIGENQPLNNDFTASVSPKKVCPDENIQFSLDYTEHELDYRWNIDGKIIDDDKSFYMSFDEEGLYPVSFTMANNCGADTVIYDVVEVAAEGNPDFPFDVEISSTQLCPEEEVTIEQGYGGFKDHIIDFGDGTTSNTTQAEHAYSEPGAYPVTVEASTYCEEDTVYHDTIYVVDNKKLNESPWFAPNPPTSCPNSEIIFYHTLDYASYSWDFGDGNTSTGIEPVHAYSDTGLYEVTLEVENSCGYTVDRRVPVEIEAGLPILFEIDINDEVCPGVPIEFHIQTPYVQHDGHTFTWEFDDTTYTDFLFNRTFDSSGTYPYTVTVANSCGDSMTRYGEVTVVSHSDYDEASITISSEPACPGEMIQFTHSADYGIEVFEWDFGDGNTSTDAEAMHAYDSSGTYKVKALATNLCGDTIITRRTVSIDGELVPDPSDYNIGTFSEEPVCPNTTFNFYIEPGDADIVDFGDGTVVTDFQYSDDMSAEYASHSYGSSGTYLVEVTITNSCGNSFTVERFVTVSTEADAEVQAEMAIELADTCAGTEITMTGEGGTSHFWDFGDGTTESVSGPTSHVSHTFTQAGTYNVQLVVTNDCDNDDTVEQILNIVDCTPDTSDNGEPSSVRSLTTTHFEVYPNPASDKITIRTDLQASQTVNIKVVDAAGRVVSVLDEPMMQGNNEIQMDVAHWQPGNYFLTIQSEKHNETVFIRKE